MKSILRFIGMTLKLPIEMCDSWQAYAVFIGSVFNCTWTKYFPFLTEQYVTTKQQKQTFKKLQEGSYINLIDGSRGSVKVVDPFNKLLELDNGKIVHSYQLQDPDGKFISNNIYFNAQFTV